jgi:hypothetical protein
VARAALPRSLGDESIEARRMHDELNQQRIRDILGVKGLDPLAVLFRG